MQENIGESSVGPDNRIVFARVRLSLRKKKTEPRKGQYDWNLFKKSRVLQEQYTVEVHNRFQPLQELEESATDRYERFTKATQEAAEKVVSLKKRGRKTRHSEDPRMAKARHELNNTYGRYKENTTEVNRQEYSQAKIKLKAAYITVEEKTLSSKIREEGTAGRKQQEERIENWYNHFKNLLGDPPSITDEDEEIPTLFQELDIKEGPFEQEEYEEAKKTLVEGKANGEDGIPPEVLKRCDEWNKMLRILKVYGIPERIVSAIGSLYEGTRAKVITPDGDTRPFEIQAGVLQGDTLAPYLFVIVLDYTLRVAIEGREEELGFQLMNVGKTKFMAYNQQVPVCLRTHEGTALAKVEDVRYLGSHMESTSKDINSRKATAWRACKELEKIWKSDLPRKLKIRLFLSTVESVLLYGREAWTVTPKLEKQLDISPFVCCLNPIQTGGGL
ncbi:Hypp3470 [Branchiostoma lanceolatum]|uniref:Hypp3470 protein n=1 Tax=Branchiostoma lanceolatum TaxID=7740 RepID=A0A8K0A231_BRALA|nr:Hypp3470 [Branchiostoma lanceolatum]